MLAFLAIISLLLCQISGLFLSDSEPQGILHGQTSEDMDFDALRLVRFLKGDSVDGYEDPVWVTEREKLEVKREGRYCVDITEHPDFGTSTYMAASQINQVYHPPNSTYVARILPLLSTDEQQSNLEKLTSFYTRYYNSDSGHASSRWLHELALNYTEQYATSKLRAAVRIDLSLVSHKFKQESVVIRLLPNNVSSTDAITIIGAHCDSLNLENPFARSPGAEDDGSGTVTVLEAYRSILESGYIPSSPLEFHLYAGEEGGLLGSLDIADWYVKTGKTVRGMIQFDMVAWVAAGSQEQVGVMMNRVDPALTEWQKLLIDKYLDIPWAETKYPRYASSDHQSWIGAGYPAAHVITGTMEHMNHNAHRATDAIDISPEFSFKHLLQFTKLAVAFAVELSDY